MADPMSKEARRSLAPIVSAATKGFRLDSPANERHRSNMEILCRRTLCYALSLSIVLLTGSCGDSFQRGNDLGLLVSPNIVSFGAVPIGQLVSEQVTIKHTGTKGTIQLELATLVTDSPDFAVEGPDKTTLNPGDTTTVMIYYTPSDVEHDVGTLVLAHNMPGQVDVELPIQTVIQAPLIQSVPVKLDFGDLSGGTSADRNLLIRNIGTAPVTVTNMGLDLKFGAPFDVIPEESEPTPFLMDVGDEANVTVRFSPPIAASDVFYEANLRFITDHKETTNRVVPVLGMGRHSMLIITPAFVDFGTVVVDSPKVATIQVQNIGGKSVAFNSIALADHHPSLTLLGVPEGAFSLQPFESLTLTLRFAPKEVVQPADDLLGYIHLSSDDYVWPERDVSVFGRSSEPSIQVTPPDVVDMGIVGIGFQHQRRVEIANVGVAPLTIQSVVLTGDTPADFSISGLPMLPVTLAPTGVAYVEVAYINPGEEDGEMWGAMTIGSDDPVAPMVTVNLRARNTILGGCVPRFVPPTVNFGVVGPGTKVHRVLYLVNDGSLPCTYTATKFLDCKSPTGLCQPLVGTSEVFLLGDEAPAVGETVYFSQELSIPIWYAPIEESGEDVGLTSLTLVDGSLGIGPVFQYHPLVGGVAPTLKGVVGTAGIVAEPDSIDFGLVRIGCASPSVTVSATRLGEMPIDLAAVTFEGCDGQYEITGLPGLPTPLFETGDAAVSFDIRYVPTKAGDTVCAASLQPNVETAGGASVVLAGQGSTTPIWKDTYQQAPENQVDILFVVDNSGSMSDEQLSLVQGFQSFIDQAALWNVKYQIGVVTTDVQHDGGVLVGTPRFVVNADPDPFKASVQVGTEGSGDERGLLAAWLALQENMMEDLELNCTVPALCPATNPNITCVDGGCGGPNRGFLRDNAKLAIIWVSDEEDHSPSGLAEYVAFFKGLKPPGQVRGYAIVGDPPSQANPIGGCGGWTPNTGPFTGPSKGGEPAQRYADMAEKLGGSWYSICAFGIEDGTSPSLLEQIGADAFQPVQVFPLTQPPVQGTIVVKVDGVPCPTGWTYDGLEETVVFDPASTCFPGPDTEVSITYELDCLPI